MRSARALAVATLAALFALAVPAGAQVGPPVPAVPIPEPPPEAQPARDLASPAGWTACGAAATGSFLLVFVAGAAPGVLPVPVPALPVSPLTVLSLVNSTVNPVFAACGLLGAPVIPPECTTDEATASAPFVGQRPAGLAVNQIRAIEHAGSAAAPPGGAISGPLASALGCADSSGSGEPGLPDLPFNAEPAGGDVERAGDTAGSPPDEVLGRSIADARGSDAPATGDGPAAGIAGGAPADAEQAAVPVGSAATWTPLRVAALALLFAIGLAVVLRGLLFLVAPAAAD